MKTLWLSRIRLPALAALVLLFSIGAALAQEDQSSVVEEGKQVTIEYTLSLDDGTAVDGNVGGEPFVYQHGQGQLPPALEQELAGLKVNDTKEIRLSPEEGFGPVNPDAFQNIAPEAIPEEGRKVGTVLMASDPSGNQRPVRVHEVHPDRIVLDFNHPLAGKHLNFDVRVLDVE